MKALKLLDSNHFLRYGGKEHVLVLKLKCLHSPHVKEQDWEIIESVGIGSQYKHDSLEIFDHVIEGEDFKKLALDLLQSRLLINREGYCYLESEIVPSSSNTSSFNTIQYYRINDLFGWSKYKVTPKITMVWNRREVERGHIIIDYENKDKTSPELLDKLNTLQQKVDTLINNNSQSSLTLQPQTLTPTTTPTPTPTPTTTPITTTTTTTTTTTQQPPSAPLSIKGPYTFDTEDLYDRIIRYCRKPEPDQFIFEIESYEEFKKSLKEAKCAEFETPRFHAANLDWTLCIYLEGNHEDDGNGYLSLYLKRHSDRYNLVVNIKLLLRFFVYNFDHKEYVTIQELTVKKFDDVKDSKRGIAKALKITDFEHKVNNGLIRGGKCRFGVEIFSLHSHPSVAKSKMIQNFDSILGICHFNDYSTLPKDVPSYSDDVFKTSYYITDQSRKHHYTWKVEVYPNGKGRERNKSVSVFLELINKHDLSSGRLFVNYEIRLKHKDNGKYHIKKGYAWFTFEHYNNGFEDFISISDFEYDNSTNYVIKDTVTIEVYFNKFFELKKEL